MALKEKGIGCCLLINVLIIMPIFGYRLVISVYFPFSVCVTSKDPVTVECMAQ